MGKTDKSSQRKTRASNKRKAIGKRCCPCVLHDALCPGDDYRLYRTTSHDYSRTALSWLIEKGYVSEKQLYICNLCINFAQSELIKESNKPSTSSFVLESEDDKRECDETNVGENSTSILVNELIHELHEGKLNDIQISDLCTALGSKLNMITYMASEKNAGHCTSSLDNILAFEVNKFIDDQPPALVAFLRGITGIYSDDNTKKLCALCGALEQIYFARNLNFVGPQSFSKSIVNWTLCGSKTAQSLHGYTTPSGSITTLKKILKESSKEPNRCFPKDIDVFADNTQKVCKTTRVKVKGTTPISVATNTVFIQSQPPTDFQSQEVLKPCYWLDKRPKEVINSSVTSMEEDLNTNYFRPYKQNYQSMVIDEVVKEIDCVDGKLLDNVTLAIENSNINDYVCCVCKTKYDRYLNVCPHCGYDPSKVRNRTTLYNVPTCHPEDPPVIKMGEIIGVNPNSKENIKQVLLNICEQTGINKTESERKWVRIGFDGVPYRLANELVQNTIKCDVCDAELQLGDFANHTETCHNNTDLAGYGFVFGSVLLVPGAGHIEKNFILATFTLCRNIFLDLLADSLGFKSKRAKDFISQCSNHHVSWQILMISTDALAKELVYQYVMHCKQQNQSDISMHSFLSWKDNHVVNPNYNLIYDLVFNVFIGLKCYRAGIRRNNSDLALAGRQKVSPIMYIQKHQVYQPLILRDMQIRCEAPPEVKEYIRRNEAFSRTGDNTRGEGGDYVTEAENRSLKCHLPPGVPTMQNWIESSRCDKALRLLREKVYQNLDQTPTLTENLSRMNFEHEVQMFRQIIRSSEWLDEPCKEKPLTSIDGKYLNPNLVNFYFSAKDNYSKYKTDKNATLQRVFVTQEDEDYFNNVNSWTIKKIDSETQTLINNFSENDRMLFQDLYQSQIVKTKAKKDAKIRFFQTLQNVVDAGPLDNEDDILYS